MFMMLNYRIVAALIAVEVFLLTVLFEGAGPLLGAAMGAAAGAVIFAVGRSVIRAVQLPAGARAEQWLLIASVGAFAALFSFYVVVAGSGAARWGAAAGLVAGLVAIGVASARLNRITAAGAPAGEEDA